MLYSGIREIAKTGDLLLVNGDTFVSKLIRYFTEESFSHVAMLFWLDKNLFVAEMIEGVGFRISPASQWVNLVGGEIYYGESPSEVNCDELIIDKKILSYRADLKKQEYGYLSLILIYISQYTGLKVNSAKKVCSTFVQDIWESCGVKFDRMSDPGDFEDFCTKIIKLER